MYFQNKHSQQSTGQKFGSKLSKNVNAAQQVYKPAMNYSNASYTNSNVPSNLPISSRSNRNGMAQFANQNANSRSKNSKNNLDARKVPTPKNNMY